MEQDASVYDHSAEPNTELHEHSPEPNTEHHEHILHSVGGVEGRKEKVEVINPITAGRKKITVGALSDFTSGTKVIFWG